MTYLESLLLDSLFSISIVASDGSSAANVVENTSYEAAVSSAKAQLDRRRTRVDDGGGHSIESLALGTPMKSKPSLLSHGALRSPNSLPYPFTPNRIYEGSSRVRAHIKKRLSGTM